LGFGSLRTLEGQIGLQDRTYARSGSRTLMFLVRMYARDHRTYALQIIQGRTWDHTDVYYFLEYPLDNTWMYDAAFGLLCK
jgi:hypothetical protein